MNMKPILLYKIVFLDGFISVYNAYVFVHVSAVTHYAWIKQGQRARSKDGALTSILFEAGFLVVCCYVHQASWSASFWRSSRVCLPPRHGSIGVTQTLPGFLRQTFCCHGQKQRQTRNEWVWQCASAAFNLWILGLKFSITSTGENSLIFQFSSWVYISCGQSLPLYPTSNLCSTWFTILLHHAKRIEYSVLFPN